MLRYHQDFLRTTLTARFPNSATSFGWSSLHMSYNPHPNYHNSARVNPGTSSPPLTRHVTPRTSDSSSTTATSRHTTSTTKIVPSSAGYGRHSPNTSVSGAFTTSSTRGARLPRLLGPRLLPSAERFRLLQTRDLRLNRPPLLFLTLGSTQNLRPLLPGVPETGVTRTARLVRHGSLRILLIEARQPPSGASDNRGANPTTMHGFSTPSTGARSCRHKNFLGRVCSWTQGRLATLSTTPLRFITSTSAQCVAETERGDDVVLEVLGMEGWAVESQVSHYAAQVDPRQHQRRRGQHHHSRNGIPGTLRPSLPCQGLQAQHRLRVLSLRRLGSSPVHQGP